MKTIEIAKGCDFEIKPFVLESFTQDEASGVSMYEIREKITKKELKDVANDLGLEYDNTDIIFAKKLLNAYLRGKK